MATRWMNQEKDAVSSKSGRAIEKAEEELWSKFRVLDTLPRSAPKRTAKGN